MEARIARLESDVAHLCSDVTEIKATVGVLRDRMDAGNAKLSERLDAFSSQLNAKFDGKLDGLNSKFDEKLDGLNSKFDSLKDSFATAKIWALFLYIALAAVNLGTLARGLGWI